MDRHVARTGNIPNETGQFVQFLCGCAQLAARNLFTKRTQDPKDFESSKERIVARNGTPGKQSLGFGADFLFTSSPSELKALPRLFR
jgi:hypothetical protein